MRADGAAELDVENVPIWQSASPDFDQMCDSMEVRCAEVVDALVHDLPIDERIAVHHVHLGAVWRLNRQRMEDVYERARQGLSDGLYRRGIS